MGKVTPIYCQGCPRGARPATQKVTISFTDEREPITSHFCDTCSKRIGRGKYLLSVEREPINSEPPNLENSGDKSSEVVG